LILYHGIPDFTKQIVPKPTSNGLPSMALERFDCYKEKNRSCKIADFFELMLYACPHTCGQCEEHEKRENIKKGQSAAPAAGPHPPKHPPVAGKPPQETRPRPRGQSIVSRLLT